MTSEEHAALLCQQDHDRAEESWAVTERELDEMAENYYHEEEEAMTDQELCDEINASLRPGWEAFSPLGDGVTVQGYLTAGRYGAMGHGKNWRIVFASDAAVAVDLKLTDLNHAMSVAEVLAGD